MIKLKSLFVKGIFAISMFCPQLSAAEGFTGTDLLEWDEGAQNHFIATSITMAAFIAGRTSRHTEIAKCMAGWYSEKNVRQERHVYVREKLTGYPDAHPQAIILAVIEEACGDFRIN